MNKELIPALNDSLEISLPDTISLEELKKKMISPYCIKKAMDSIDNDAYIKTLEKLRFSTATISLLKTFEIAFTKFDLLFVRINY